MDVQLKTTSFGGYDKKAVESYIDELVADHDKEVSDLKANVVKLSETVKNLHTMREVNLNESNTTIENLKKVNDELQAEVNQLREQLASFKNKEEESASRYESISRTLLEARESADALLDQTARECEQLTAETTESCNKLMNDTNAECQRMHAETVAACDKLNAETKSACQEMKESTYANCEDLRRRTKEETDALIAETEYACNEANEQTKEACEELMTNTTNECEEMKSPVILGVSEGAGKYMCGFKTVAAMVKAMDESLGITVPVALHLDHGTYEGAKACIEAGFTSIMFDGSHYSIEENIAKTKELVELAHDKGLSIEAEVGSIGGVEDGVVGAGEIADPEECAKITDLGIDFLAAGIGNIHGVYPENWKGLDFEALERIHQATHNIPLVLHGGTGIPDEMIHKAITLGVSKININTECQLVFAAATRAYIEAGKDQQGKGFDPRKLLAPGAEAIRAKCAEKIQLFGSENKA